MSRRQAQCNFWLTKRKDKSKHLVGFHTIFFAEKKNDCCCYFVIELSGAVINDDGTIPLCFSRMGVSPFSKYFNKIFAGTCIKKSSQKL